MPITWCVEPDGRFVRFTVVDPYTLDEWRDAMTAILDSATVTQPLTLLVDRRRTQSLSKATVEGFNRFFTEHRQALTGGRCAIVLSSGVYFQIAEMVRTVLRIPNTSIRTFQDYDEALAWLVYGSHSRPEK
jgi:SpoIIAA-like